jgi:hypothetical protein
MVHRMSRGNISSRLSPWSPRVALTLFSKSLREVGIDAGGQSEVDCLVLRRGRRNSVLTQGMTDLVPASSVNAPEKRASTSADFGSGPTQFLC